jgi:hypothetical protein
MAQQQSFGKIEQKCKICSATLPKSGLGVSRELVIKIKHKASGTALMVARYVPPLCDKCGGDKSLLVDMSWENPKP